MEIKETIKNVYIIEDGNGRKAEVTFTDKAFSNCKYSLFSCGNYSLDDWFFLNRVSKYIMNINYGLNIKDPICTTENTKKIKCSNCAFVNKEDSGYCNFVDNNPSLKGEVLNWITTIKYPEGFGIFRVYNFCHHVNVNGDCKFYKKKHTIQDAIDEVKRVREAEEKKYKDKIKLDPRYWDCECEEDYIHSKIEHRCHNCGAYRDEMPDSRVNEVDDMERKLGFFNQ